MGIEWLVWIALMVLLYKNIGRLPRWVAWPALLTAFSTQLLLVSGS
jgi:predicted metal-binding membrane protein